MVKAQKVAVWKIDGKYYEEAGEAEKAARILIIRELVAKAQANQFQDEAELLASIWDEVDTRVKAAMAGA